MMQRPSLPEIAEADVRAAREFLLGERAAAAPPRRARAGRGRGDVVFREGISRARNRAEKRDD